jgi:hypothetical protein
MKTLLSILGAVCLLLMTACTENYSNGERIGLITQFSKTGLIWKSWEGHLNLTQTGMNSSSMIPFDFSVDNDNEPAKLVLTIDSAAQYGWKVKLIYHETFGKNWFKNRGQTAHFVKDCIVLDKNPVKNIFNNKDTSSNNGKIIDTIYVMIVDKSKIIK